ncbi:MAG: hypothetical protein HW418_3076, partial [Anaerolineales bacterium]|nr:hypothetical protein [Anaerolineales bacterium]
MNRHELSRISVYLSLIVGLLLSACATARAATPADPPPAVGPAEEATSTAVPPTATAT